MHWQEGQQQFLLPTKVSVYSNVRKFTWFITNILDRNDTAHEMFVEKASKQYSMKKIPTKQQNPECSDDRVFIYQLKKE